MKGLMVKEAENQASCKKMAKRMRKKLPCSDCDLEFGRKKELQQHRRDEHGARRENVCRVCKRVFESEKRLKMHLQFHNIGGEYECFYCQKQFNKPWKMKIHLVNHSGKPPYICQWCGEDFLYPGKFMQHMKHLHDIWYTCKECGDVFAQDTHPEPHKCKIYGCKDCRMSFVSRSELAHHVECHIDAEKDLVISEGGNADQMGEAVSESCIRSQGECEVEGGEDVVVARDMAIKDPVVDEDIVIDKELLVDKKDLAEKELVTDNDLVILDPEPSRGDVQGEGPVGSSLDDPKEDQTNNPSAVSSKCHGDDDSDVLVLEAPLRKSTSRGERPARKHNRGEVALKKTSRCNGIEAPLQKHSNKVVALRKHSNKVKSACIKDSMYLSSDSLKDHKLEKEEMEETHNSSRERVEDGVGVSSSDHPLLDGVAVCQDSKKGVQRIAALDISNVSVPEPSQVKIEPQEVNLSLVKSELPRESTDGNFKPSHASKITARKSGWLKSNKTFDSNRISQPHIPKYSKWLKLSSENSDSSFQVTHPPKISVRKTEWLKSSSENYDCGFKISLPSMNAVRRSEWVKASENSVGVKAAPPSMNTVRSGQSPWSLDRMQNGTNKMVKCKQKRQNKLHLYSQPDGHLTQKKHLSFESWLTGDSVSNYNHDFVFGFDRCDEVEPFSAETPNYAISKKILKKEDSDMTFEDLCQF